MKLFDLQEMAKAITAKTCGKCGNPIVDRNYYFYKGGYFHKGGCAGAATTPAPAGTNAIAAATRPAKAPAAAANPEQAIRNWLNIHGVENFKIDPTTGVVDVDADVVMDIDHITKLPVKFGIVTGSFDIGGSNINTLEGCPHTVGKSFNCSHTDITSFDHAPQQVGRSFIAGELAQLTTLRGLPRIVPGTLDLAGQTKIQNLEGISEKIGTLILPSGKFSCHNIHKMVKYIRSHIVFQDLTSTHWLGILFIDGMKDGISIERGKSTVEKLIDPVIRTRSHVRGNANPALQRNPDDPEPLPYRDVLNIQEQLIDAGFAAIAKT